MASSRLSIVYATDEDVFVVGGADWSVIVPRTNRYAAGTDGAFAAGSPWTLTSASSAFASQGVAAGMIVELKGPTTTYNPPQYLAVETVGATTLVLRRPGAALNEGLGPGPSAGLTGVTFTIQSLKPQIENAAFELNERYSVDPKLSGRKPADIYDQRIFRRLTALWVLYQQYANLTRAKTGDFADKIDFYRAEYEASLATATLRWGPTGNDQPPTNKFGMRLAR